MFQLFNGKGQPFKSDFKMPSDERKKELVDLMAKCNLQESSLYKSYSIDSEKVLEARAKPKELEPLDDLILNMLKSPLADSDTQLYQSSMAKLCEMVTSLPPDILEFYHNNICKDGDDCTKIFHESIEQSLCDKWYEYRKYLCTASIARKINNARNEKTRYKHFTG